MISPNVNSTTQPHVPYLTLPIQAKLSSNKSNETSMILNSTSFSSNLLINHQVEIHN